MANPVKFSDTPIPSTFNFVRNKDFYIGTSGGFGPSETTGWYNGPAIAENKYAICYGTASAEGFIFHTADEDGTQRLLQSYFGHALSGSWEGIVSASLANNIGVLNRDIPLIPKTTGLMYYWDANLVLSSVSGSSRIFSIGKAESEGVMSSELWQEDGQSGTSGSWEFNGSSDSIVTDLTSNSTFTNDFSIAMWVKIPTTGSGDMMFDKSDGTGLSHNGVSIELSTATIVGTEYASWLVTIDGETEFYTRTLASVFPYDTWNLLVWSFEDRKDYFWLGQDAGTPNEITYTRDNSITNITATNAVTLGKNTTLAQDYLSGSIGMVAIFNTLFDAESVKTFYTNTKNYFIN